MNPPRTSRFPFFALLVVALAFFLAGAPVSARLRARAEAGLGNSYRPGGWTPVRLLLENPPDPDGRPRDFEGSADLVVADAEGRPLRFSQRLDLPVGARKLVEIPVLLPGMLSAVTVELNDDRQGPVLRQVLQPGDFQLNLDNQRRGPIVRPTVVLVAGPSEQAAFITAAPEAANQRQLSPAALPRDYKGYDGIALVVFHDAPADLLDSSQLEALRLHIALGGRLLVIGGRTAAALRVDPFLAPLLPAPIVGMRELPLREIDPAAGTATCLAAEFGEPTSTTRVLWASPAGPIALERPYGMGTVSLVAFEAAGLGGPQGSPALLARLRAFNESLVLGPTREDLRARHTWATSNVVPFSGGITLPSRLIVLLIILTFALVVGPVNFSILRRRRRLELAWLTIPALSIVFFVAIYGYGAASKGGDQRFATIEMLHLADGATDGLLLWQGIQFSPDRRIYSVDPGVGGAVVPLLRWYRNPAEEMALRLGAQPGLSPLQPTTGLARPATALIDTDGAWRLLQPVAQWQVQYYQGERPVTLPGSLDLQASLRADGRVRLAGRNDTGAPLENAVLHLGAVRFPVGLIPAGEAIDRVLSESGSPVAPVPEPVVDEMGMIVNPATEQSADATLGEWEEDLFGGHSGAYPNLNLIHPLRRCRLVARQGALSGNFQIVPAPTQSESTTLLEADLPLAIEGTVNLTTTRELRREIYDYNGAETSGGRVEFGESGSIARLVGAWIDVVIGPPRLAGSPRVLGGTLSLTFTSESQLFKVEAFDYTRGGWTQVFVTGERLTGSERSLDLPIRSEWINPFGGHCRLRLQALEPPEELRPVGLGFSGSGVLLQSLEASMQIAPAAPEAAIAAATTPGPGNAVPAPLPGRNQP